MGQASLDHPLIRQRIEAIQHDLERLRTEFGPERLEGILVRQLALHQQWLFFERIYADAFGSQLRALSAIATRGPAPTPVDAVRIWYDQVATIPGFLSLENWLSFLTRLELVQWERDAQMLTITDLGRMFLLYLHQRHLTLLKPL